MFQVGEMVVHPGYGAGKVVDVEKLSCLGSDKQYYSIKLLDGSETQVWKPGTLPTDHQQRYGVVRERLEDGDILQIAVALRDLSWKDHSVSSLTSEGKRLYDKGMKLLTSEVALVQGDDRDTVESEIERILNENMAQRETSS